MTASLSAGQPAVFGGSRLPHVVAGVTSNTRKNFSSSPHASVSLGSVSCFLPEINKIVCVNKVSLSLYFCMEHVHQALS